jgi:tRNA pseudouridine-54 N-methylase
MLNDDADLTSSDLGFVLSDDQPLGDGDLGGHDVARCSLGSRWLQGHAAVHIVHWLLDRQV